VIGVRGEPRYPTGSSAAVSSHAVWIVTSGAQREIIQVAT
jgi:hypothetical protein